MVCACLRSFCVCWSAVVCSFCACWSLIWSPSWRSSVMILIWYWSFFISCWMFGICFLMWFSSVWVSVRVIFVPLLVFVGRR